MSNTKVKKMKQNDDVKECKKLLRTTKEGDKNRYFSP
jgi:hypothetical protein